MSLSIKQNFSFKDSTIILLLTTFKLRLQSKRLAQYDLMSFVPLMHILASWRFLSMVLNIWSSKSCLLKIVICTLILSMDINWRHGRWFQISTSNASRRATVVFLEIYHRWCSELRPISGCSESRSLTYFNKPIHELLDNHPSLFSTT